MSKAIPTSARRRMETDVMKLLMSDHDVKLIDDCINKFQVILKGPPDSPYEGGVWRVRVELPSEYPFKSPSIGFVNRIFHPNIDEMSGSVCLDVINQTWSPMYELINVFEVFLPQLLLYPNASDPLNGEAASMYVNSRPDFIKRVKDYVRRFASQEHIDSLDGSLPGSQVTNGSSQYSENGTSQKEDDDGDDVDEDGTTDMDATQDGVDEENEDDEENGDDDDGDDDDESDIDIMDSDDEDDQLDSNLAL
eukprot:m.149892 g.149892  ORF g.149892 m.149892 type:complete len:250 (+) comp16166_c0_seq1:350-1099(+)